MAEQLRPLIEFRENPYELLRQMESRSRLGKAASGIDGEAAEWVGIGFLLGDERFLVGLRHLVFRLDDEAFLHSSLELVVCELGHRGLILAVSVHGFERLFE